MCLPVQGKIENSLMLILNGTGFLNKYYKKMHSTTTGSLNSVSCWFIQMLDKFPSQTSNVLTTFVKAILTDSDLSTGEQLPINLDICVRYESAMFSMCNVSLMDFLCELSCSRETCHRLNCVEMIGKLLLVNSDCNWKVFRDEVSGVAREIQMLKILSEKFIDINNNVKIKAINVFLRAAASGNKRTKQILKVSIIYKQKKIFYKNLSFLIFLDFIYEC